MPANELEILKTAIVNETEGYEFYRLAADKVTDPDTKAAFEFLAGEEEKHKTWLLNIYQSLSRHRPVDRGPVDQSSSPGIFEQDRVTPESGSLEVSVFRIGILMEKASMEFYRQAAQEAETQEVRDILSHLASWENGHLEMLEHIYDRLREEWWEKQGFSPA